MESLDNILSGNGEASPEPETNKPVEEAKAQIPAESPAADEPQDEVIEQGGRKMVPLEALTETRGKVKRYTEQVAAFETTLKEREAAWDRRFSELLQTVKQPQQQPEQQAAPDFYADPDAALKAAFAQNLAPLHSQLQETRTALLEERLTRIAGGEKASKIEAELSKAMNAGDPEIPVLQNALRTQGPAAASLLVDWYDKRTFDPVAERERIKAEILAELKGAEPPQPQASANPAVMPSNLANARNVGTRAGPAWSGPKPIADIFKR